MSSDNNREAYLGLLSLGVHGILRHLGAECEEDVHPRDRKHLIHLHYDWGGGGQSIGHSPICYFYPLVPRAHPSMFSAICALTGLDLPDLHRLGEELLGDYSAITGLPRQFWVSVWSLYSVVTFNPNTMFSEIAYAVDVIICLTLFTNNFLHLAERRREFFRNYYDDRGIRIAAVYTLLLIAQLIANALGSFISVLLMALVPSTVGLVFSYIIIRVSRGSSYGDGPSGAQSTAQTQLAIRIASTIKDSCSISAPEAAVLIGCHQCSEISAGSSLARGSKLTKFWCKTVRFD
ncbi:hypothetical protein K438DRAFT_1786579 [Mycena galopus ATCC 62051]|nr:hypothetical protein K438DRAFT_1786579 [Mycena galopus ATCC 62051]